MGQRSSASTSKNEFSDTRIPPTWGSNLLVVNERSDNAISREVIPTSNSFGMSETIGEVERFVDNYQKNVIHTKPVLTANENDIVKSMPEGKCIEETENEAEMETEEENDNEVSSMDSIEMKDDTHFASYLKQLEEYKAKQRSRRAALEGYNALPAQAGIPITTPKSSPLPKRRVKADNNDEGADDLQVSTFGVNDGKTATENKSDGKEPTAEESDEEYREWEKRLKHVQEVLEKNLKRLNLQKTINPESPDSQK